MGLTFTRHCSRMSPFWQKMRPALRIFTNATCAQRLTRPKIAYVAVLCAVAIAFSVGFHWRDMNYPACSDCDAIAYGHHAFAVQKNGILKMSSPGRTYGYPLFLSMVLSADTLELPMRGYFTLNVAVVQILLYLLACLTLFFVLRPVSEKGAWCSMIGLLCNPFILNYVPLRLTEGLTVTLAVALATIVSALSLRAVSRWRAASLILLGSLI